MSEQDLKKVRVEIDGIDQEIQNLITQRVMLARKTAQIKSAQTKDGHNTSSLYRPEREAQVLKQVVARNQGANEGLSDDVITHLFREIMSACLAAQKPLHIAYLGPPGTYTQEAAQYHFGGSAQYQSCANIAEVFKAVNSGAVEFGVVPVENSTGGVVSHTHDNFVEFSLKVCGEIELAIHHNLLVKAGVTLKDITTVYAHQQSLSQCHSWLGQHIDQAERIPLGSNAEAAKQLADMTGQDGQQSAVIAGKVAADIYGLDILQTYIEDERHNATRFLVIGNVATEKTGHDKTSLMLTTENKAGALFDVLEPFKKHNISMNRIESRPAKNGTWEYLFFVDISGHIDDEDVAAALDELKSRVQYLKILGSYPKAI